MATQAFNDLKAFCEAKLFEASAAQVANLNAGAPDKPDLSDFNVGTVFSLDGKFYAVPNPPSETHARFNELRVAWQQAESA